MRRRLFTALSVLCLLLCLVTVALWIRSFMTLEQLAVGRIDIPARVVRGSIFTSNRGLIAVNVIRDAYQSRGEFDNRRRNISPSGIEYRAMGPPGMWRVGDRWWNRLGFCYSPSVYATPLVASSERLISFPYWFVLLLGLTFPVSWVVWSRVRLARRRDAGGCSHCGYNLTGNTSGTCPECGKPRAAEVRP
jgi:hypothetical protein